MKQFANSAVQDSLALRTDASHGLDRKSGQATLAHVVLNTLLFQIAWFDLLYFHSGVSIIAMLLLFTQFCYVYKALSYQVGLRLVPITLVGMSMDSLWFHFGIFTLGSSEHSMFAGLVMDTIPQWLVLLWLGFALTLVVSFKSLLARPITLAFIFALFAPLSYLAGLRFGMLSFETSSVALISVGWFLVGLLSSKLLVPCFTLQHADNRTTL